MTPEEIIRKQAEAVTGFDKMKAADHLEAAAKLLRKEAKEAGAKQSMAEFKADKERRRSRVDRMAAALTKHHNEKFQKALEAGGWKHQSTFAETGIQYYIRPGVAGSKLVVHNGKFRVYAADTLIQDWTDTKFLQTFVDSQKKKQPWQ